MRRLGFTLLACASFCACGGGGGGSKSTIPSVAATAAANPANASAATAQATLQLSFARYTPVVTSSGSRRPAFVSPATSSVSVTVLAVDGVTPAAQTPQTFDTAPGSAGCAVNGGTTLCSFSVAVPVGSVDLLRVQTYSGTGGSGTLLGSATTTATITANAQNLIALALGGTIAALDMLMVHPQFPTAGGTSLLVVVPLDGSGAQIVNPGAYASPITITSSDPHFLLILNGGSPGASATITSPSDQIVVQYDGHEANGAAATIAAATTGIAASAAASVGTAPISVNASGASAAGLTFTALGQSSALVLAGGSGTFAAVSSAPSIASVTGSGSTYAVAATGFGSTVITFKDSANTQVTVPVTVVPPAITSSVSSAVNASAPSAYHYAFPQTSGSLTLALAGGTHSYAVSMASSGTASSGVASIALSGTSLTVTPVGPGTDFVIVTSGSVNSLIEIDVGLQPLTLTATATTNALVANGTITIDGSGSAATLSISGGNGLFGVPTGCEAYLSIAGTSPNFNLSANGTAGTCTLSARDSAGTTGTIAVVAEAPLSLTPPGPLTLAFGSSASITISGGVAPYSATATNSLSAGASGSTLSISANHAGNSVVTVKDALGVSTTINVTVSAPLAVTLTTTSGKGLANASTLYLGNGAAGRITPANGTTPYSITDNGAAACSELSVAPNTLVNPAYFQVTESNTTPAAGSCIETIHDSAGATVATTVTVVAVLTNGTPTNGTIGAPVAGLTNINGHSNASVLTVPIVGGKSPFSIDQQPDASIISAASIGGSTLSLTTTLTSGQTTITIVDNIGQALTLVITTM